MDAWILGSVRGSVRGHALAMTHRDNNLLPLDVQRGIRGGGGGRRCGPMWVRHVPKDRQATHRTQSHSPLEQFFSFAHPCTAPCHISARPSIDPLPCVIPRFTPVTVDLSLCSALIPERVNSPHVSVMNSRHFFLIVLLFLDKFSWRFGYKVYR